MDPKWVGFEECVDFESERMPQSTPTQSESRAVKVWQAWTNARGMDTYCVGCGARSKTACTCKIPTVVGGRVLRSSSPIRQWKIRSRDILEMTPELARERYGQTYGPRLVAFADYLRRTSSSA